MRTGEYVFGGRFFGLVLIIGVSMVFVFPISGQQKNENEKLAAQKIEHIILESGINAAIEKIEKLKLNSGGLLKLKENDAISLGKILLNADKNVEAIKILLLALDTYPESMLAHFFLSRAYKNTNNRKLEIDHFQKYIKLRWRKRADQIVRNLDSPPATSAKEVIERGVTAMGGEENFKSIKTMIVKLRMLNIANEPRFVTRYYKRPGFYRMEKIPGNNVIVKNEEGIWQIRNDAWTKIEGDFRDNILHDSTIDHEFIGYSDKGVTYDFLGIEGVRDAAFYKIKKTFVTSDTTYFLFFNVETNLLEMEDYLNPNGVHRKNFYDYRNESGILISRVSPVSSNTLLFPPYVVLTEEIKINVPVDDSLFKKSK